MAGSNGIKRICVLSEEQYGAVTQELEHIEALCELALGHIDGGPVPNAVVILNERFAQATSLLDGAWQKTQAARQAVPKRAVP